MIIKWSISNHHSQERRTNEWELKGRRGTRWKIELIYDTEQKLSSSQKPNTFPTKNVGNLEIKASKCTWFGNLPNCLNHL